MLIINNINRGGRVDSVDIAKGIGIILVYIGHIPPSEYVLHFIYNFHMPLFFFLAGIFLKVEKYNLKDFIISRCKSLLIPLITFCLFSITLGLIPEFNFNNLQIGIGGVLWFLPVLYLSEILVYIAWRMSKRRIIQGLFVAVSLVIAICVDHYSFHLPFAMHAIPMAIAMIGTGSLLHKYVTHDLPNKLNIVIALVSFMIMAITSYFMDEYTNMYNGKIMCGIIGIAIAYLGTNMIVAFSKIIDGSSLSFIKRFLLYCGKNSLIIFGTHLTLINLIERFVGDINIYDPLKFALGNFIVILCIYVIIELINKKIPWCIGKLNNIKKNEYEV